MEKNLSRRDNRAMKQILAVLNSEELSRIVEIETEKIALNRMHEEWYEKDTKLRREDNAFWREIRQKYGIPYMGFSANLKTGEITKQ